MISLHSKTDFFYKNEFIISITNPAVYS